MKCVDEIYITQSDYQYFLFQLGYLNMENVRKEKLTLGKALSVLKDVFIAAAERDIYTGDSIAICIINEDGIQSDTFNLRRD